MTRRADIFDRLSEIGAAGALTLLAVGFILIAVSVGGYSSGYSIDVYVIMLRVGVAYLSFAAAIWLAERTSVVDGVVDLRWAGAVSAGTLALVFGVGVAVMYVDLGLFPPEQGTPLTVESLLRMQAEIALLLAPVASGYLASAFLIRDRLPAAVGLLVAVAVTGWYIASSLALSAGAAPGFTEFFNAVLVAIAVVLALPPIVILTREGTRLHR